MKARGLGFVLAFLFSSTGAFSMENRVLHCDDSFNSILHIIELPYTPSTVRPNTVVDVTIVLKGPVVDYLLPKENRAALLTRYPQFGFNSQTGEWTIAGVRDAINPANVDNNIAAYFGVRNEPLITVKPDEMGVSFRVLEGGSRSDSKHVWHFDRCQFY